MIQIHGRTYNDQTFNNCLFNAMLTTLTTKHPGLCALANGLLFNVSWFAIVSTHSDFLAPIVACVHLLVHFALFGRGLEELQLVLGISLVGIVLDKLLFIAGIFSVAGQATDAPLWLSCLWPVLATTLMHAFRTLQDRLALSAAVGAIGGTLSYLAGTRLSDISFNDPFWGPVAIAVLWAVAFPTLLVAARAMSLRGVSSHAG